MSSVYSHLGQTGISQLAAGCEVQLLQGLKRDQGVALWVWSMIFHLLLYL